MTTKQWEKLSFYPDETKKRPVTTKFGEMSDPPHIILFENCFIMIPTWNGMECGVTAWPFTILLIRNGPPHLQSVKNKI